MTTNVFASPFARPFNPFLANDDSDSAVDASDIEVVDAHNVSYALVQNGPAVSSEETESHADAVEVKVTWGSQVLSISHLEGSEKGFSIGEGADFELPNAARTSIVDMRGGVAYVVLPANSQGTVSARGDHPRAINGGEEVVLAEGMTVRIELDPVTIEISSVRAGKKTPVGFLASLATAAAGFIGLSAVGHAAIVASLAMFMPKMSNDDAENIGRDQMLSMRAMMDTSADREQEQLKQEQGASDPTGGGSKPGEQHQGESGETGLKKPVATKGHLAFKGADDHVRLSKKEELQMAREGGFVGILMSGAPQTGASSPWATESQLGTDADNKIGKMFGETADDATGNGGLGLWGTGEGGGGHGVGIGMDGIGTVGGGGGGTGKWGFGKGDKDGFGNGHGPGSGAHQVKAPNLRPDPGFSANGHLPPEVIQRIVRQNFGRFRLCYENGLRNNPGLTGRVVTKFVIDRNGAVSQAADGGSDLASQEVVSCVVRQFQNLSFPAPEGGIATVIYPIALSPGQ